MSPGPGTPDVMIGGRGYVEVRNRLGSSTLWPVDLELSPEAAEEHYRRVADVLARQIEKGTAPWLRAREPGHALPENAADGEHYRGQNALWLQASADHRGFTDPRWGTRANIAEADGTVRPGETGTTVLAWHRHQESGQQRVFALTAFNAEQCDGFIPHRVGTYWRYPPLDAREILSASGARHDPAATPHYDPASDTVTLPPPEGFPSETDYLRAGLRQAGHWTGHPSRLARESFAAAAADPAAATREELRGEIHAMLAGCRLGVGHAPRPDPPLAAWAAALRSDPREILRAAAEAEQMLEFTADRARPRPPTQHPAAPAGQPTPLADLARQILQAPPWERSR